MCFRKLTMWAVAATCFGLPVAPMASRAGAPAGGEASLPRLVLWARGDDLIGRVAEGERVALWPDASGQGNHLTASGDERPFFLPTGPVKLPAQPGAGLPAEPANRFVELDLDLDDAPATEPAAGAHPGRLAAEDAPVVQFRGSAHADPKVAHSLKMPLAGEWQGATLFVVASRSGGLFETAPGRDGCFRDFGFVQLCGSVGMGNPFGRLPPATRPLSVFTFAVGLDDAGAAILTIYRNGELAGQAEQANSLYGVLFLNPRLGCHEAPFNGNVAELLVYHGVLDDGQRQRTEAYLLNKYSLSDTSPEAPTLPWGFVPPVPPEEEAPPPPVVATPPTEGLLVWAGADDLAGLADNAPVERWPNRAGAQAPLVAEDPANRPLYVARGMNRRPVVRFQGEASVEPRQVHRLELPVRGEYPEMTLLVAGRQLARPGVFDSAPGRVGCLRTMGWVQLTGQTPSIDHPFALLRRGADAPQIIGVVVGRHGEQGQTIETYANGHRQARVEWESLHPVLFARPQIGANNFDHTCFNGDIAELLLYDRALTPEERVQAEAYLIEKYGIAIKSAERLELERNAFSRWTLRLPHLPAHMSWLGNSFSGKTEWVQSGISGIAVMPDGTVAATSIWDEPHKEIGFYRDGQVVGPVIKGGASQIAYDERYFYVGHSGMGKPFAGVRRYRREGSYAGTEAPWPECGADKWIRFETGGEWREVTGLAVHDGELFVSSAGLEDVRVYNAESGALKRAFPIDRPGKLAIGPNGMLWHGSASGVRQLTVAGEATGKAIADIHAGALAFSPEGHLLVAAGGERQQIVRYDIAGDAPRELGAIGIRGGVWAPPRPGAMGDDRLWNIMGVGADVDGNLYAQCNGQLMRSYAPDGALRWQLECSVFCVAADFDPATEGTDLFTRFNRYRHQPGQPPGRDWQWSAVTYDPGRFPELAAGPGVNVKMRRFDNGHLYRYSWTDALAVHRQEAGSDIFRPVALYMRSPGRLRDRPKAAPEDGRFLWVDHNDNGFVEAGECTVPPPDAPRSRPSFSVFVDDKGGIWEPQDRWGVRHLPLRGFTEGGAPVYDFADEVWFPKPPEFSVVLRAWYFPADDTMYLSGNTWNHPATGKEYVWGCTGREIVRYDHWTTPERAIRSRMVFPHDSYDVKSAAIAHDANRALAVDKENVIFVYDTRDGALLGIIEPDKTLVGGVGWMDIDSGLNVFRQPDGTLILAAEESWAQRILIYRIAPDAQPAPPPDESTMAPTKAAKAP